MTNTDHSITIHPQS